MKISYLYYFIGLLLYTTSCNNPENDADQPTVSLTHFVDPFIGTGGHGHTYPGATIPNGMLQVSPDNGIQGWDWCSGYHYSDSITIGFSHLHLSGTGIGDLTDIRLMPINKKVNLEQTFKNRDEIPYKSSYEHTNESASPGYYNVYLNDHNVRAELTSDLRTAFHKYTFEKGDIQSIILDLGYTTNWDKTTISKIKVVDKHTLVGYRHSTGWAKNQKVFFAIKFSKSMSDYTLVENAKNSTENEVTGPSTAAQLFFNTLTKPNIYVKVALSSVSEENAMANMHMHNGKFAFDEVKTLANNDWENLLSKIEVETPHDTLKTTFYTALYHSQVAPVTFNDANGEFRLENDSIIKTEHLSYSTLSLWDTFRAAHPLMTLVAPDKVPDIINSMLLYYTVNERLPVWTLYGNETNTMTGYHSIPVIAEAYIKGIRGFDIEKAYKAMKATMMQDERGLNHYKKYGYIPHELLEESVTITLEYAYNDYCVAQIAKALGKTEDHTYFLNRSKAYMHLFDLKTGFMRGKNKEGTAWREPFDPKHAAHRKQADYTEGNAWQHSWFVLHDAPNLVKIFGGEEEFTDKLEQLFTESSEINGNNVSPDISGLMGQYAHGNEPSHHIAYLFNYANKPWRTQYWVREILKTQYNNTPNGLSGNEDCGQMSAWYVLSALGFYAVDPALGEYQIGSPLFEKSKIKLGADKIFTIIAENSSDTNRYIQSATLNGIEFNRTSITHAEILNGGTLHFKMGKTPNKSWGTQK